MQGFNFYIEQLTEDTNSYELKTFYLLIDMTPIKSQSKMILIVSSIILYIS